MALPGDPPAAQLLPGVAIRRTGGRATPPGDPGGVRRLPTPDAPRRAAEELVRRLRRWSPASWALPASPPAAGTRAEVAAGAVQRIADLSADAERRPRRPVPRLGEAVLPDQLAVVVDDVLRGGDPGAVRDLAAELTALRAALGFAR